MTAPAPYREPAPLYQDIWEWDIVIVHGDVKIIGRNNIHIDHCAYLTYGARPCGCEFEKAKTSSPIVRFGRRLVDSPYKGEPVTGDARPLLTAKDGTTISVLSGKTYRLNGPRATHKTFSPGSIWKVYAEADAELEPEPTRWQRFLTWWKS